jgi:acyl-CoA thioesterase
MPDIMEKFISRSEYAKLLGIRVTSHGEGRATAELDVKKEHLNSFGTVHGAVYFSLADEAFAVACNSRGQVAMAVQASISFFRPVTGGRLTAVAKEADVNPKLGTYLIDVLDGDGRPAALFQGTAYRKKETVAQLVGS